MDTEDFWSKWGGGPKKLRRHDGICPRCEERPKVDGSYCRECRRVYQREWMAANRPSYADMTEEQRRRTRCRAYTNVLVSRGKLKKKPCVVCGTEKVEAHHQDYSNPRLVVWKCRLHRNQPEEQIS
jgi:ribosomal protein S27AE